MIFQLEKNGWKFDNLLSLEVLFFLKPVLVTLDLWNSAELQLKI